MATPFHWYETVPGTAELAQGDFVDRCPILMPPQDFRQEDVRGEVDVDVEKYNVVVMSQSCDLQQGNIDIVLVCPSVPLDDFGEANTYYQGSKGREALRRGYCPGYHLLNRCELPGFESGFIVVDFRNVFGVHFSFLKALARQRGLRRRLLPPYREHLSQAFARFFMRVGLPVDIPSFTAG